MNNFLRHCRATLLADADGLAQAVASPLQGWLDRLSAARTSRRLRRLFIRQSELHAQTRGKALYAKVVQTYLGVDSAKAQEIVDRAATSYASWPADRPVNFRDVAHYLVAMKLTERRGHVEGEIRNSVHSRLPSQW